MIKPFNDFVLVEPVVHQSFVASQKETFDEVGLVIDSNATVLKAGMKVYFDSWTARKYPNPDNPDTFFWLVPLNEIAAYEEVSK